MRSLLLLLTAASLSAEVPPAADVERYEQLLAAQHFREAGALVDKLMHQRAPSDGKPRPDPLINAMIGRIFLHAGHSDEAGAYLDEAPIAELPLSMRGPTALDHARSLEVRGDPERALAAYREAAAASQSDADRRKSTLGMARNLLPQDPAGARALLMPIAEGQVSPERWEARYLLAAASSLSGDSAAASKWADQSWADAATAPLTDIAPLKVEVLRAGLAAAARDVGTERAMLTASNGLALVTSPSLAARLPVCGDGGVRASDTVIFGYVSGPFGTSELIPIAANRPEAVPAFRNSLAGTSPVQDDNGQIGFGTVFTASCRTIPSARFEARRTDSGNPLFSWAIKRGLYPATVFGEANADHSNPVADWIDAISARFGKDSPLLIVPRSQLLYQLQVRAAAGETVLPGQLADLRKQIADGMRRVGAAEWIPSFMELQGQLGDLASIAQEGGDPSTQAQALIKKQLEAMPFDIAAPTLLDMFSEIHGTWPAPAAQAVLELNAKAPASLSGRDRQSWALNVAGAQRAIGQDTKAQQTLIAAGFPQDACPAMDSGMTLLEQHFSYEDYPEQLTAGEQEGTVLYEYGLNRDGKVAQPRVVYSFPSGLFDEPSAKGLAGIRYAAPTRGGKPATCRGLYQPIRWQLEDQDDLSLPTMTVPQSPGPTS